MKLRSKKKATKRLDNRIAAFDKLKETHGRKRPGSMNPKKR